MQIQPQAISDARLFAIRETLQSLEAFIRPVPGTSDRSHAAVSLILRESAELAILLIRRAELEGDPWSGHMALPGGRQNPEDTDLLQTAVRETEEETGISLSSSGLPLGRLHPLVPSTRRLPPISIFPYVFAVPEATRARPASREVDEVFWASMSVLKDPTVAGTVEIPLGDTVKVFPCFRLEGRVVWGLTYRILSDFLTLVGNR